MSVNLHEIKIKIFFRIIVLSVIIALNGGNFFKKSKIKIFSLSYHIYI
jgi:hypothetical protein